MRTRFLPLAAVALLGIASCNTDTTNPNPNAAAAEGTGELVLRTDLVPIGVLARSATMTPTRLVVELIGSGGYLVEDTVNLAGAQGSSSGDTYPHVFGKTYTLPGNRRWSVFARVYDQQGNLIYRGSTGFELDAGKSTMVGLQLNPLYSTLRLKFPVIDSINRISLVVDGRDWGDSSFQRQSRVGDTIRMEHDYLDASPGGVSHSISIRVRGSVWRVDTLLYSKDTTLEVISGRNLSGGIKLNWVGPVSPPPGMAGFFVGLGAEGVIDMDVTYADKPATVPN